MRLDQLVRLGVGQGVLATPDIDLFPPIIQGGLVLRFLTALRIQLIELGQHVFDTAHDRHINFHALGNYRRININMNDLAWVLTEVAGITNHSIIKPCTHCDQNVAMLHGHIGFVSTVHAGHADVLIRRTWIGTQTHQGSRARSTA